jgi:hypothetical protein
MKLAQLDYWVAKAQNIQITDAPSGAGLLYTPHPTLAPRQWAPSRYWSQGGPIIEAEHIDLNWDWENSQEWTASMEPDINAQGKSVLEAAMRTYVIAKLGENVEAK